MAKTFRFTDDEEKALIEMALRINRELVKWEKCY
jgi:acetylglutamate kinase